LLILVTKRAKVKSTLNLSLTIVADRRRSLKFSILRSLRRQARTENGVIQWVFVTNGSIYVSSFT
jgi:hypothetical protein